MICGQIRNGRLRLIKDWDALPTIGGWIDLTGFSPLPTIGQIYNSITNTFSNFVKQNRPISLFEFYCRFTNTELAALETDLSNTQVKVLDRLLKASEVINLRHPKIIQVMTALVARGIITEARKNEILA